MERSNEEKIDMLKRSGYTDAQIRDFISEGKLDSIVNYVMQGEFANGDNGQPTFINPTGGDIRERDDWGDGFYMVRRSGGQRRHAGIDLLGEAGTDVRLPFSGNLENINDGIRVTGKVDGILYSARLLHMESKVKNGWYQSGTTIGSVGNLKLRYDDKMQNHVHLELYKITNNKTIRLNPTKYFFKK